MQLDIYLGWNRMKFCLFLRTPKGEEYHNYEFSENSFTVLVTWEDEFCAHVKQVFILRRVKEYREKCSPTG